jgi:hypothetical protein
MRDLVLFLCGMQMSVKGQEETEITDSNPPPTTNIQDNIKGKVTSTCCILYSVYSPLDNVVTFLEYDRFFRRPSPLTPFQEYYKRGQEVHHG